MTDTSEKIATDDETVLYVITCAKNTARIGTRELRWFYRLKIPATGEMREASSFEPILRSLAADQGFYLRRK